jgi:hypothetical protein
MTRYIVNVVRREVIALRWTTVHQTNCRYVRRTRRGYVIDAAEVLRLHSRIRRGDGGAAQICKTCRPDWTAAREGDAT